MLTAKKIFFFNNAAIQNLLNQIENDVDFLVELASEDREDVFVVDSKSNFYKEALKHINEVIPKNLLFEKEDKKYWEKIVKDLKNKVDPENKNTFCSLRAFFLFLQRKPSFFS
jgi:hypothetical protein